MTDEQRPESRSVGRPSDYDPAFCEIAINLGREGKSKVQIAAALGVSRKTIDNWGHAHEEFLRALEFAKDLEQAWWENIGQTGLEPGKLNAPVWSRSMAARFPADWREKSAHEVSGPNGGPIRSETNAPSLADFYKTVTRIQVEPTDLAEGGTD